jgi:hypothetical protein
MPSFPIVLLFSSLLFAQALRAQAPADISTLAGFSLGDKRGAPTLRLGQPVRAGFYADAFEYEVFKLKADSSLVAVFEFSPVAMQKIWSVELSGEKTDTAVFAGLKLGASARAVEKALGPPGVRSTEPDGELWLYPAANYSLFFDQKEKLRKIKIRDRKSGKLDLPEPVNAVITYLLHAEYPERYTEQTYKIRPVRWTVAELNGDPFPEVVMLTKNHYRLTPTVHIYTVQQGRAKRWNESLAPGMPIAAGPDYLDEYTAAIGRIMDARFSPEESASADEFISGAIGQKMRVVQFANAVHTARAGDFGGYTDCSWFALPDSSAQGLRFPLPDGLAAGSLEGQLGRFVLCKLDRQLFVYQIIGTLPNGRLDKTVWQVPLPDNFGSFAPEQPDGIIRYLPTLGTGTAEKLLLDLSPERLVKP